LYCLWSLSRPKNTSPRHDEFPENRVAAHALKEISGNYSFPEWFRSNLEFTNTAMGLVCLELGDMENTAVQAGIAECPGPSYTETYVVMGDTGAKRILAIEEIAPEQALLLGLKLREAVERARKKCSAD
jgi:hypothetical protein